MINLLRKIKHSLDKMIWKIKYLFSIGIYEDTYDRAMQELLEFHPMPKSSAICEHEILPKEYDLTIIVPTYNAEKWINQCIDSILNQVTQYSYELIVIDDGSTDNTGAIIDNYCDNTNVKIIHQKNNGYSGARNVALKELKSEYIMFVDSDDYIIDGTFEKLLSEAKKQNADIVEANGFIFNESGRIGLIKENNNRLWGGPCLKIMRSKLWKNVEFPEGYVFEDMIIGSLIYPLSNKTVFINDELYAYRIHSDSITQSHNTKPQNVDSLWIMLLMEKDRAALNIDTHSNEDALKLLNHIVITYRRTKLLPEYIRKDIFVLTKQFIEKHCQLQKHSTQSYKLYDVIKKSQYKRYCLLCSVFDLSKD